MTNPERRQERRPRNSNTMDEANPPPWEVVGLLPPYLDAKTLATASCVSKSWYASMSAEYLWESLCITHYPSVAALRATDPSVSYRRLLAIAHVASVRRRRTPPKPRLSVEDLTFVVDLRTKNSSHVLAMVSVPCGELLVRSFEPSVFRFEIDGKCEPPLSWSALEDVVSRNEELKMRWQVVMKGWEGMFTMMECEEKLNFAAGADGWFSQELPSPGCCTSRDTFSGIVADFRLCFSGEGGGGRSEWRAVKSVNMWVGMLNPVSWRYISIDDGLRYLQHFLLSSHCCHV